jgi:hypothetical protein
MPELTELLDQLAALRREAAAMLRDGCTPTQFLKLQRDVVRLWAAVEQRRLADVPGLDRRCLH